MTRQDGMTVLLYKPAADADVVYGCLPVWYADALVLTDTSL
jgi:hypothetical protein